MTAIVAAEVAIPRPPEGRQVSSQGSLGAPDGSVHLAGTGTWLPLARSLAAAFEGSHPGTAIVVHGSIGSGGGRRAVQDGVIDVGLVSSRRLNSTVEGCRSIPVATAAIVFAVHPSVPTDDLTETEVVRIFTGEMTLWPDGTTIVPLLREQGDSATSIVSAHVPGIGEAVTAARIESRWPTLLTDGALIEALRRTPGAIGLSDLGSIRLEAQELRAVAVSGVTPDAETLDDGRYPYIRYLVMVIPGEPRPETEAFMSFVQSEAGRNVVRSSGGYVPLAAESER